MLSFQATFISLHCSSSKIWLCKCRKYRPAKNANYTLTIQPSSCAPEEHLACSGSLLAVRFLWILPYILFLHYIDRGLAFCALKTLPRYVRLHTAYSVGPKNYSWMFNMKGTSVNKRWRLDDVDPWLLTSLRYFYYILIFKDFVLTVVKDIEEAYNEGVSQAKQKQKQKMYNVFCLLASMWSPLSWLYLVFSIFNKYS